MVAGGEKWNKRERNIIPNEFFRDCRRSVTPDVGSAVVPCARPPPELLKELVPRVGFEPTAYRLRSGCSTAELPGRRNRRVFSRFERGRQAIWHADRHRPLPQGRSEVERGAGSGRDRQRRGGNRPGRCTPGKG